MKKIKFVFHALTIFAIVIGFGVSFRLNTFIELLIFMFTLIFAFSYCVAISINSK